MPRMPVKEVEIQMGGDYEGFNFTIRKNLKASDVDSLLSAAESKDRIIIRKAYARIVKAWNFCDEEGEPLALGAFDQIPDELVWEMVAKTTEALTSPPKPPSDS
jgi:hypothetical protein